MYRSRPFRVLLALLAVLLVASSCSSRDDGRQRERRRTAAAPPRPATASPAASTPPTAHRHRHRRHRRRHHQPGVVVPAVRPDRRLRRDLEGLQGLLRQVNDRGRRRDRRQEVQDRGRGQGRRVQRRQDRPEHQRPGRRRRHRRLRGVQRRRHGQQHRHPRQAQRACVPNIFAATGSPAWGNPDYPWLIGSTLAPYTLEGQAFADTSRRTSPTPRSPCSSRTTTSGQAYEEGFEKAIEGTDIKVVEVEKYAAGSE